MNFDDADLRNMFRDLADRPLLALAHISAARPLRIGLTLRYRLSRILPMRTRRRLVLLRYGNLVPGHRLVIEADASGFTN